MIECDWYLNCTQNTLDSIGQAEAVGSVHCVQGIVPYRFRRDGTLPASLEKGRFVSMNQGLLRTIVCMLAVLLVGGAGVAYGQLQTGNLFGTATDNQGEALPGVTVTLSGIGAPKVQVTNAEGQYRFPNLAPGKYELDAQLEGFSTVEYPDVVIAVGRSTTINVTLTPAVEEVITVTSESPLLDERKLVRGNNVSAAELDQIPTARDPWSLLSQAPGVVVDRINVGGNESGQQSNFLGTGATSADNTFAVDGVVLTDMAALGGSLTYYDFGAFEEVQFTTSSADVTNATSGVTINQVTKRGGNEWAASARYLRTDGDLQSTPSTLDNDLLGNQIDVVEEYGADIGGPLIKDRLWIWAGYGESDIGNIVVGGQLDRTMLEDLNTKLNFQASDSNSGVLHYWTNDKLKNGRGAGPQRQPETTHNQITPADIWKLENTHIFSSNFFITGLWSQNDGVFNAAPQGGRDADVYWDADGVLHGSYWDFAQNGLIEQGRLDASYFFNSGGASHELKFGGSFRTQENDSGTVWPGGKMVYDCEFFGCGDVAENTAYVQFWRNRNLSIESSYDSFWVQDTISKDRWTINVGLRYDKQEVENLTSTSPANPDVPNLLPEITFPGNDAGGFDWETIVPRIGVTYALGEDRKTLIRGTFSQYTEQLGQGIGSLVNPVGGYSYASFYFDDANGNLVLDAEEFGSLYYPFYFNFDPANPTALSTINQIDPDLDPILTNEFTFGVDHSLSTDLVVGATLTYRTVEDIPDFRLLVEDENGNIRPALATDWELAGTVSGELPNGQTGTEPFYTLRDNVTNTGGSLYTTSDREQEYLGITVNATKRLSNRWRLSGHFTWADWDWKTGPEFRRFDDPTDTTVDNNELDYQDNDEPFAERSAGSGDKGDIWAGSRWSFSLNSLFQIAPDQPWGFNLGASVTGREGFVSPPYANVGGPSRRVQIGDFDAFRNDDIITFDARIDKDFKLGDVNLTLSIDGFNLLNEDYVLQRQRNLNAGTANNVREVLSPRVFRVGVKLAFN